MNSLTFSEWWAKYIWSIDCQAGGQTIKVAIGGDFLLGILLVLFTIFLVKLMKRARKMRA